MTLFIDLLGFGLILPLLPVYIAHFGGKPYVGGLLMATFSTMQFLFAPIWGRASDRYGRRPFILLSLSGSALSYLFFGASTSLAMLFIARVASGILTAASMPTAQAYIADVTPPEKRAGGMAILGAAFGLGFAFGPMIGGLLSRFSIFGLPPLGTPAYFAATLALLNFIWAFFMLPESHTDREMTQGRHERGPLEIFPAIADALRRPTVGAQLTVFAFVTFAFTAVESSFSWLVLLRFKSDLLQMAAHNYASQTHNSFALLSSIQQQYWIEKAQTAVTSGIFTIVGITMLLTQGAVMGGLARRLGEHRLVMAGSFILTGALIGLAFAPSLTAIRLLSVCIAVGSGVLSPSLNALITQSAGPQERGLLSGAQQGLGSLARIIAPPLNNRAIEYNTALPFLSSFCLMLVAFVLSLRLGAMASRPAPPSSPSDDEPGVHNGDLAAEPDARTVVRR